MSLSASHRFQIGAGLALALAAAAVEAAPILSLTPADQTLPVGATVSLDLDVSGLGDGVPPSLGSFDVLISFDAVRFTLTGVSFSTGLGDPDAVPPEAYPSVDDGTPGLVQLVNTSVLEASSTNCVFCIPPYLDDFQPGAFRLATLTWTARRAGTGLFSLTVNAAADGDGLALALDVAGDASATVTQPVPEPPGLALFALGIAGLGLRRCLPGRRRGGA